MDEPKKCYNCDELFFGDEIECPFCGGEISDIEEVENDR